ncbi:uncharacterized protein LOC116480875 isoform X1 [Hylobates moloch]|uniref:uncharacterized protein LOC116480875 isoform X1 n=1 Tax=Hylobates moloch TaxID=81572 RepID=UPI0013638A97|nr:uncharacterized protein LOC116480875 isoform X1 [Hylobates moloch]
MGPEGGEGTRKLLSRQPQSAPRVQAGSSSGVGQPQMPGGRGGGGFISASGLQIRDCPKPSDLACPSLCLPFFLPLVRAVCLLPVSGSIPILWVAASGDCSSPTGQPGDASGHCPGSSSSVPGVLLLVTSTQRWSSRCGCGTWRGAREGRHRAQHICSGAPGPLTPSAIIKGAGSRGTEVIMIASARQKRSRELRACGSIIHHPGAAYGMEGAGSSHRVAVTPAALSGDLSPARGPGLNSLAADGARAPAANLARRCQPQSWQTTGRREEELLAGQADPPPPGIELKTPHTRLPHSSDHPSLPLTGSALRSPNSSSPSAPFPTPSRSSPPAALTRAGVFAYLHMQIITFAYGAPQGCLHESRLAVCPPSSLGTCRKGLGQGPRGWG